ncbi:MAG: dam 1 [Candidatus Brocadiaceae bacterium]|nr:dam 1 [Candidatus Brocadiaceae bacterium]
MTTLAINKIRSPVSRMGGKSYLASWISRYVPGHVCYVEPFCGAGHLLFSKSPSAVEILNDVDKHLTSFFLVLQEPGKRQMLTERLDSMLYSRILWQDIRSRWKAGDITCDEIERVSQWFYLNRTCFGGDQRRGGFAVPSTTGRNPVQSFRNAVTGLDAEHYYGKDFTQEDHHRLADILHDVQGKVMVSHYKNGLYDDLYRGWRRYEYSSFKGSHKAVSGESKPKTVECLWINFEPPLRNKTLSGF